MKRSAIFLGVLRVLVDFSMVAIAFLIAREIRTVTDLIPGVQLPIGYIPGVTEYLPFVVTSSFFLVLIFALSGFYSFQRHYRLYQEFLRIIFLSTIWVMGIVSYFFLLHDTFFSRLVLVYGWVFSMILLCVGRILIRWVRRLFLKFNLGISHVLFLGNGETAQKVMQYFQKDPSYKVVGYVFDVASDQSQYLGKIADLESICLKHNIDEVIQTNSYVQDGLLANEEIVEFCKVHHIRYRFVPDLLQIQHSNIEIEDQAGIPIIEVKPTPLDGWGRVIKRLFDLVFSIVSLILLSPLLFLLAILIKLTSEGPVFFLQKRVGYHGKEFWTVKFRTMVKDAEKLKKDLLDQNERKGPLFKIKNDPRITRIGHFLRRWSLDELPQLFNVLLGTMSLVGPRPHLPIEVAHYQQRYRLLFAIKPGISGMAQVSGRSGLDFEDEVRFDLYYIQNWSLLLDIFIILKTFWVVVKRDNAD